MRYIKSVMGFIGAIILPFSLSFAAPAAWSDPVDLTALARIDHSGSRIADFGSDLQVELALSQPVPWRVFTLDAPRRLVADFGEVDFADIAIDDLIASDRIQSATHGKIRDGWSRLVLELVEPMAVETAGLSFTGSKSPAVLKLSLAPTSERVFADRAGAPQSSLFELPPTAATPVPLDRQRGDRPLRVVLDPGHGGLDPGAKADGMTEADIILSVAQQVRAGLEADGHIVTLTREADVFVPVEQRIGIARAARADVFLSLHADALSDARASGAAVYTLGDTASDAASERLAAHHDRADLLAGVELLHHDHPVALVRMDVGRLETEPRSERLAAKLVDGLSRHTGDLHKQPRLHAGFSVLKAPDIPSVLVALGSLSSPRDRANLTDSVWRRSAVKGICEALAAWATEDAAEARLLQP